MSFEFLRKICRSNDWWNNMFVSSFGVLASHYYHAEGMQFIPCPVGDTVKIIPPAELVKLRDEVIQVVSSSSHNNHFVIMVIDIRKK